MPLTPGALSVAQLHATSVVIHTEPATGGTAPYLYELQIAPDLAGAPGGYTQAVPPGTALDMTAAGLEPSTKYWFRLGINDNAGGETNTGGISATTLPPAELEPAIVALLKSKSAITDLAGNRIAAVGIPDALARPNVIYQRIDTGREWSNDGPQRLARAAIQISCYADEYPQAKQLARSVRSLDGFRGYSADLKIAGMFLDDERDAPAPPPAGQTRGIAGIVLIFNVDFYE